MPGCRSLCVVALMLLACTLTGLWEHAPSRAAPAEGKVDFERDVLPLFKAHCFSCHGETKPKGKLRMDSKELAMKGGTSGASILPGKGKDSYLVKRMKGEGGEDRMPLDKPALSPEQIATIARWIDEGANWPDHTSAQGAKIETHWSFIKPVKHALPAVKDAAKVRNAIDSFVLARLEKEGLTLAAEADRHTLIRRLSLDLIGLPPTPEEVDAFVNDASPDAYEKLVKRLLDSPRYGERWARRWMDLARYADTNGYEKDRPRSIWPWRDWVINALNSDMPFDRFTIEQIAGDMLPNATVQQIIATGFHRNTMINEEGGIDPLEYRYHAMVDRVGATGTAWLGLTVSCAQCHNHKYDPISQKEYFRMMAFLNNADEPEMEVPSTEVEQRRERTRQKMEALTAALPTKFPINDVKWAIVEGKASATAQQKVVRLGDGSYRLDGEGPEKDTYVVEIESGPGLFDRIRLEALTDGKRGPGRTPHGNFVLSEITVTLAAQGEEQPQPVKLARAEAAFSQEKYPVAAAIDGKVDHLGWAIAPQQGKSHTAAFHFEKPLKLDASRKWTVKLEQQFGGNHTLAKFRLALGSPLDDGRSVEARRQEAFEKAYAAWLEKAQKSAARWTMVRPSKLESSTPILTPLEDGSVLASGDITKSDTYIATYAGGFKGITAIKLEALPHESLPKFGPGKIHYEGPFGDFFLSEMTLLADGQALKLSKAVSSFGSGIANTLDGDAQSGWSINGGQGQAHWAVFALAEPSPEAKEIAVRMLFEKYYAAPLGRFRIWASDDPKAAEQTGALPPEVEAALLAPAGQRDDAQRQLLVRHFVTIAPELAEARKEIDGLRKSLSDATTTLVMRERPADKTRVTRIHKRGEFTQPTDAVEPGLPQVLPGLPSGAPANRLGFAQWLVSRENPLTARVFVNRTWQAFFGRGLVRTMEDFGIQGEKPTHPELLDYLAVEFMDRGWSMKELHRLIVTSATYRQSSKATAALLARDPKNELLGRGARFRLDAEMVRDSALQASGLLSGKIGGPSVFPPQPASITTEGAYGPLPWNASGGEDRYRRSIYTFAKRTAPFAMYNTFDAPGGEACVARRDVTNTPLQALTLLNDQVFMEAAQALGKLLAQAPGDDAARAEALFRRVLGRSPAEDEQAMLLKFVVRQKERFEKKDLDPEKLAGAGEGDVVTRAAWTSAARAMMNLDEAVTKP